MKTKFNFNMKSTARKVYNKAQKHSPEILAVLGVVGVGVSFVMACNATLKVDEIVEDTKVKVEKIHTAKETGITEAGKDYSEEDSKKDLTILYAKTGVALVKLYAPSVGLCMLSVGSLLTSNNILRKRNVALAAAYATIDKSYKDYRGRVVEKFGEEIDRELRHGIKAIEVKETIVDEDGKKKTIKSSMDVIEDPSTISDYAKFFDAASEYYEDNAEYNLMFLKGRQNYANDLLRTNGRVFLNEVYDMLGLERTRAGQMVGWTYDPDVPNGDNYIDFGIYNINRPANRNFVNGFEPVILLDFNVDGNVWETM